MPGPVAQSHGKGGKAYPYSSSNVVTPLDGLPKKYDKVTTSGRGGGHPVKTRGGPLSGWRVGGGKRAEVFGKTFNPSVPEPKTLRWGFLPFANSLAIYPSGSPLDLYYRSLPQNITRPGGELMEVMLTPMVNTTNPATKNTTGKPSLPFFFISDDYSGSQISIQLRTGCPYLIISDPIPFNSTGNIQQGSVVQSYRGYTAAMALQGYNNAQELPGNPNLVPNPPFPSNASWDNWECMNETIGAAIPLMEGYHVPWWTGLVAAFSILVTCVFAGVFGTCWWKRRQKKKRSTPLRE